MAHLQSQWSAPGDFNSVYYYDAKGYIVAAVMLTPEGYQPLFLYHRGDKGWHKGPVVFDDMGEAKAYTETTYRLERDKFRDHALIDSDSNEVTA